MDAEILVAIGVHGRGVVLGYKGPLVEPLFDEGDGFGDAREVFPANGYPTKPGFYLWSGDISVDYFEPDNEPTFGTIGQFAVASTEIIASMLGRFDPPLTADEYEGREKIQEGDYRYYSPINDSAGNGDVLQ